MNEEILPSAMMKAGECILPDGTDMKYRLFVPECEEEIPVVVYLHGSGFRGSDNLIQIDNGYICHFLSDEKCIVHPVKRGWEQKILECLKTDCLTIIVLAKVLIVHF